jgi:hypothetical protein
VTSLSANYRGLPEMYRLLKEKWIHLFNISNEEVSQVVGKAIRDRIESSFNAKRMDQIFPRKSVSPNNNLSIY